MARESFVASVALPSWIWLSLANTGWKPWSTAHMPQAIIRAGNGRRHEVDFEDAEIRIEVYSSDETVEILVEAQSTTSRLRIAASLRYSTYQSIFFRRRSARRPCRRERQDRGEHNRRSTKTPRLRLVCRKAVFAFAQGL